MFFGKMRTIKGKGNITQESEGVTGDVTVNINSSADIVPISPYIYGANNDYDGFPSTLRRLGGNSTSAYNWVDGFINMGSDWEYFNTSRPRYNPSPTIGQWVEEHVDDAFTDGSAAMVTIPMCDYVAADLTNTAAWQASEPTRFRDTEAAKGTAFSLTPTSPVPFGTPVYQDEFVNWLLRTFENTTGQNDTDYPIFYSLDNEPALWSETHENTHPERTTYVEAASKGVDYAAAIKAVYPGGKTLGPVVWGWTAFTELGGNGFVAPDSAALNAIYGTFLGYYLDYMATASATAGFRLLDYLDIHWYPVATEVYAERVYVLVTPTPSQYDSILQSPRSLWDQTYTEPGWVGDAAGEPIQLIPRMKSNIAANYSGTELAITEYSYGSEGHIMGGLVQADVFGVFGREGVGIATQWPFGDISARAYMQAAYSLYLNFDGEGKQFGDTSIRCTYDSIIDGLETATVYASVDDGDDTRMTVVAINKTDAALSVGVNITHSKTMQYGQSYILDDQASTIEPSVTIDDLSVNTFTYSMPAYSASMIELSTTDNHYVPVVPPGPPSYDPPEYMPLISHGVTSAGSNANTYRAHDATYDTTWWASDSMPQWIAFDLSADTYTDVLLHWVNSTYGYENGSRALSVYTIDGHVQSGGTCPVEGDGGWVTLHNEVGPNDEHSKQHVVDMTGYNWLRLHITAVSGTTQSIDMNVDVHDARLGQEDSWFFTGDSITAGSIRLQETNTLGDGPDSTDDNFAQIINAASPGHFPAQQNTGIGGTTATSGATSIPAWLADGRHPGLYVPISFGTNDALGGHTPQEFYDDYEIIVQAVIAAGKIPIIPTVIWSLDSGVTEDIPAYNAKLVELKTAYPEIVDGPDLTTYFAANTQYINADGLHLTNAGRSAFRRLWAETMLTNVYGL